MTPGHDSSHDDALAWDGDDDPTLDVGTEPTAPPPPTVPDAANAALPDGYTAVGKGSHEVGRVEADGTVTMPADRAPMGNATLISLGVLGGVYLLYAIGWLIGANRLSLIASLFLDPVAFQVTLWLAVLAPPIWFASVMMLTHTARPWIRFTLLAVGVVVLVPWPFVLAGAAL
jgi:hypothetical protein